MLLLVVALFVIGYAVIVFEHPLKLDKTVPAVLTGALLWAVISLSGLGVVDHEQQVGELNSVLLHHVGKIAEILFFLIGAMTIVELIDLHQGFDVITKRIRTTKKITMLWLICIIAFFLSAVLDNLTCTIVMVSLLRRLVPDREQRIWFIGFVIIAANSGGAWSPIGDVTTTMLWIGEKVSSGSLILDLFPSSVISIALPAFIASFLPAFKGNLDVAHQDNTAITDQKRQLLSSRTMLLFGVGGLIFVPVFKTITGLPPYVGMMFSMGVVWLISEYIHPEEDFTEERKHLYSARYALSRIEMSSILFFLGILAAVAALEAVVGGVNANGEPIGLLMSMAEKLNTSIPNLDIVIFILGFLSAIIDNVPLVAATMGMYSMDMHPMDDKLWQFIAYSAGTGGSMLIIGSAAGVAAMGMERIDFIWYLKKIAWLALIGFLAGGLFFLVWYPLVHH